MLWLLLLLPGSVQYSSRNRCLAFLGRLKIKRSNCKLTVLVDSDIWPDDVTTRTIRPADPTTGRGGRGGQAALSRANMLVVGSSATATETLKNLVLRGIDSFISIRWTSHRSSRRVKSRRTFTVHSNRLGYISGRFHRRHLIRTQQGEGHAAFQRLLASADNARDLLM